MNHTAKALWFDEASIEYFRSYANLKSSWTYLVGGALLLALPLTKEEIIQTPIYFFKSLLILGLVLAAGFGLSKILRSEVRFKMYTYPWLHTIFWAIVLTTIVTYLSLFILEYLLNNSVVSNLVTSVIPFYLIVLIGFTSDSCSKLSAIRSSIVGIAITLLTYFLIYHV